MAGSFSKDSIFYAYDRSEGTFLYAGPIGYQNVIQSYDGRTGACTTNPDIDQWTGEILWETILSGVSDMAPITYAVGGRQYVAVIAPGGTSGSSGHVGQLNARSPIGPRGVGHTMFVFALPEQ